MIPPIFSECYCHNLRSSASSVGPALLYRRIDLSRQMSFWVTPFWSQMQHFTKPRRFLSPAATSDIIYKIGKKDLTGNSAFFRQTACSEFVIFHITFVQRSCFIKRENEPLTPHLYVMANEGSRSENKNNKSYDSKPFRIHMHNQFYKELPVY